MITRPRMAPAQRHIHVMDLADGHVVAMEKLADKSGVHIFITRAGVGSKRPRMWPHALVKPCKPINYHFAPRSATAISPAYWADASKADREPTGASPARLTKWRRTLHWQSRHPQGYPDKDVVMTPFNPIDHPHRRYNPLTGQWVLVSPHRAKTPPQGAQETPQQMLPPTIRPLPVRNTRVTGDKKSRLAKGTYVFTNDFAALMADTPGCAGQPRSASDALAQSARGTSRGSAFLPITVKRCRS